MTDSGERGLARRDLIAWTGVTLGAAMTGQRARAAQSSSAVDREPVICLFTKPLHNRSFAELPGVLRGLGIDAVDLTCRPDGHVRPERVGEDLPRAYGLLKDAGLSIPMITTGIVDASEGDAEAIIKTAAALGIRYAKLGYYPYGDLHKIHATLADVKPRVRDVAAMCKHYGVQAGFHNHAGNTVGAALWDVWHLIHDLPAEAIGSYFDVRHATVEGGENGWRIGMHLLAPRIIMLAVKDFLWRKDEKRGWQVDNVPLGQGMVRLEEALRILKTLGFTGPVSLHMEYGEHTPPVDSEADKTNLGSIRKDWAYLKALLERIGQP